MVRLISICPSKEMFSLSNNPLIKGVSLSKTPTTVALSSPCLIISEAALSPNKRLIQSIIKLLPAPVSPVKTVKPLLNSNSISSMMAKLETLSFVNMLIFYPLLSIKSIDFFIKK